MGAHFEALDEGVLLVPLDPRYTQVEFGGYFSVGHIVLDFNFK